MRETDIKQPSHNIFDAINLGKWLLPRVQYGTSICHVSFETYIRITDLPWIATHCISLLALVMVGRDSSGVHSGWAQAVYTLMWSRSWQN